MLIERNVRVAGSLREVKRIIEAISGQIQRPGRRRELAAWLQQRGPVQVISEGEPRVAVVGDSYAAGNWIDPAQAWPSRLAARGFGVAVDGFGRTGFVNHGVLREHAYPQRLPGVLDAANPDLVVLQGGINDHAAPTAKIAEALRRLASQAGGVRTVVVGPAPAPAIRVGAIDAVLASTAAELSLTYVRAFEWTDLPFLGDGLHLTPEGHALFGDRVAAALA